MPAPISPSCAAFSSTSEAMPFCARASAAARPPMPPPAMRILSRATDYLVVMELADLAIGEPQDTRQDLIRMLAKCGSNARRLTLEGAELEGRGRHRVTADAWLVEDSEH